MSDAQAELAEAMEESCGEEVTYTVGETGAEMTLTAVRGRNTHERFALADGRAALDQQPMDWLIRPAAIDFGAGPHTPTKGDRITTADGEVYEVLHRSDEPGVRRSGSHPTMWRLRTVRQE
jgi:hypothetical protein